MNQDVSVNPRRWWALVGLSLFVFIAQLDITIVSISLPAIQKSLTTTSTQLQWLLNMVFLGLCAFMAVMGRLGDVYGLRKVLYINGILFGLASLGAGLSWSIHWLLFFRTIQGITLATIPIAAALVAHNFPEQQHAKAMGIFSAIFGFGLALGPVVGGVIVDTIGWRWIFFVNIPVIALALLLCAFCLSEKPRAGVRESFDWYGAILLVIGMGTLILGINQGQNWGWGSIATLVCFIIAVVSLLLFYIVETRPTNQHPLIAFRMLGNRVFIPAALTCMIFGASMSTLLFLDPLYLQSILNYSATIAGFFMLVVAALTIMFPPVAGWIAQNYGAKNATIIVLIFVTLAAIFHAYLSLLTPAWFIIIALVFFGLAWGSVNVGPVVAITTSVESNKAGVMLGALWTFFNLGTSLGLAIFGVLFRYREYAVLNQQLSLQNIQLSEQQQHLVRSLLSDPEKLSTSMQYFSPALMNKLLLIFKSSFMSGFSVVMWVVLIVTIVGLIIIVTTMKSIKVEIGTP